MKTSVHLFKFTTDIGKIENLLEDSGASLSNADLGFTYSVPDQVMSEIFKEKMYKDLMNNQGFKFNAVEGVDFHFLAYDPTDYGYEGYDADQFYFNFQLADESAFLFKVLNTFFGFRDWRAKELIKKHFSYECGSKAWYPDRDNDYLDATHTQKILKKFNVVNVLNFDIVPLPQVVKYRYIDKTDSY